MTVVKAVLRNVERRYELPDQLDDVDRQAFMRWVLEVLPDGQARFGSTGPALLWKEEWW